MAFQIFQIAPDLTTGRVTIALQAPSAGPTPDFVQVMVQFKKIPDEPEAAMEQRAKETAKKALQAALAAL